MFSLSSLNPSTSRFMLNIPLPLLGCAKVLLPVPIQGVTKEEKEKEERTPDVPKVIGMLFSFAGNVHES